MEYSQNYVLNEQLILSHTNCFVHIDKNRLNIYQMIAFGKPSDLTIVNRLRAGDEKMLVYVFKEYYELIRDFILRHNGEDDHVQEVVESTVIELWQNVQHPQFLLQSKLDLYILTIAKNIWYKELKKRTRFKRVDANRLKKSSDIAREGKFDQDIIITLVQEMDDNCRRLLSYSYFDGMNNATIAEKLKLSSIKAVRNKKYKCFKELHTKVVEHYQQEDYS